MNGFDYNTQLPQQYIFQPYDPWAMYYPGDPSNTAGEDFISSSQNDTTFNSNTLVDNSPNDQDEQLHTSNVNDEANQEIRDRVIELEARDQRTRKKVNQLIDQMESIKKMFLEQQGQLEALRTYVNGQQPASTKKRTSSHTRYPEPEVQTRSRRETRGMSQFSLPRDSEDDDMDTITINTDQLHSQEYGVE